ncbi:MAG: phage holin family protein [Betaproteobacteria bacterium]|nr:phage holin family protein [Betaproteobacteria bacterium]
MRLLLVWLVNTASLVLVAYLMPSIRVSNLAAALVAALALGLVNTIVRPILILLTLPATILTLGLFIFVINALLFWAVGAFVQGFVVPSFWSAFFGSLAYSIVSWLLSALVLK